MQEVADITQADVAALQKLTSLFDLQSVDVLNGGETGQLMKTPAVHTFAQGAALGQLRDAELLCEMAADVTNATIIFLRNGK